MDRVIVFGFLLLVLLGAPIGLGLAWYLSSRRVRQLEAQMLADRDIPTTQQASLERDVEALRAQVEQLASGQEFLTRLLAKNSGVQRESLPPPPAITPH